MSNWDAEADPKLLSSRFEAVLSSISDGVFAVDEDFRLTCFNRAAETITGYRRVDVFGRPCHEILQSNICREACSLRYTIETGRPVVDLAVTITSKSGESIPVTISTALLRDSQGRVIGGVESFRDLRQVEALRKQLEATYRFHDIVGRSEPLRRLFEILPTVARSDSSVLLQGESGTGKELVARALHAASDRKDKPFVAVNCGALPESLVESELFGHRAGAFTGASRDHRGKVARAHGGTLFLDEVGELPLPAQVKLLRFLQDHEFEPVGAESTQVADVRILAATNRRIEKLVEAGTFRPDLYYRLDVIRLVIPPLRERQGDIPLLVDRFLSTLRARHDKRVAGITPEALARLLAHDYPGNVRELENIVEHAFVLCPGGFIRPQHLPAHLLGLSGVASGRAEAPGEAVEELRRAQVVRALEENGWNRTAAARSLGIHKTTLHRRIRALGIELPVMDGRSRTKRRKCGPPS
jgi:PAS domain S-box-containing protein